MTTKTKISWTNTTWNPVTGCSKVSPGCAHCYAERMDKRIRGAHGEEWRAWTAPNAAYNVRLMPERLAQPLRWKTPRMVFVNSMSDLFHELVPFEFIQDVFRVMWKTPQHTYQILTKRPARMLEYTKWNQDLNGWTPQGLENVWLGVSVEHQAAADERIPLLLQTPAAVRFLSCEPLLGEIDLSKWIGDYYCCSCGYRGFETGINEDERGDPDCPQCGAGQFYFTSTEWHGALDETGRDPLQWVIAGGESGPHFRPMNPDWARSIRDQCRAAGVPFFFKQHSGYRPQADTLLDGVEYHEFPK